MIFKKVKKFETVPEQTRLSKMMRIEWIGQTLASLFWIVMYLLMGDQKDSRLVTTDGGSSWMLSNIASIMK